MTELDYMTETEVAKFLGYSVETLRQWRYVGIGPEYHGRGRNVRYPKKSFLQWYQTPNKKRRSA